MTFALEPKQPWEKITLIAIFVALVVFAFLTRDYQTSP